MTPAAAPHVDAAAATSSGPVFTVGYVPRGFKRDGSHHYPAQSPQYWVQGFRTAGPRQSREVLTADVQRGGAVGLARYARDNGGLRAVKAGHYRAVMGWNTGQPGIGLHIVYVVVRPGVAFEVMQIVGGSSAHLIDDHTLLRVAASVRVA